ncbi:MAG: Gfo/Idh/MocA family oxidoreductase, partial [Melioribacteraceae bacterium]|nr:Gfo/Idh/MocA family oxidoreductase [Melioribacteraceae bacterium]
MKQSRREFLKTTAALSSLLYIPSEILGRGNSVAPSDKLNIAAIGAGGMGQADLSQLESENIVALCDVDWNRASESFKKYPNANKYKDFRIMLDKEKSLDAVLVAAPDHMHAIATLAVIERGLHVYCEKPLTYSIGEARKVAIAAREAKIASQMG